LALATEPLFHEKAAYILLVEALARLALFEALPIAPFEPEARGIGRVDLVDDDDLARAALAKLVLGVDQDQAALAAMALSLGKQLERHALHRVEIRRKHTGRGQDLFPGGC